MWTVLAAALIAAQPDTAQSSRRIAITNVTVIDVAAGRALPAQTVLIVGDHIASVGASKTVTIPAGTTRLDGSGKFLMPGLWDMHGHLFSNSHKPGTDDHAWHFPLYIATGVTGVRDMWTNLDEIPLVRRWAEEARTGRLVAPRVAVTGPMVNGADGILRNVIVVTTAEEARAVVDRLKDGGAEAVKIHSRVPRDAYFALMARARERRIPVVGHVPAPVTLREAIEAGQHSVEHLNGVADACARESVEADATQLRERSPAPGQVQQMVVDGYDERRCEDVMRRLREAGVWQVPTLADARLRLVPSDPSRTTRAELKYVPKTERADWEAGRPGGRGRAGDQAAAAALAETRRQVFEEQQNLVGMMQRFGVPLMTGTDVSNPWVVPGFSVHDELALFVESGMTPAEALRAATLSPARFLGRTQTLGTVARGKLADLVLLDADPLVDIHNTLKIQAVVAGGRYFDRAALDGLLAGLARD